MIPRSMRSSAWARNIGNRSVHVEAKLHVIVLDTDILTFVQRGESAEYSRLVSRLEGASPQPICVTIVSFEEQMRGWLAFTAKAKSFERQIEAYARLRGLLEDFQARPILDFDDRAAGELKRLIKSKTRIGTMDLKIAAIALVHGATLVSRNLSDFRKVEGLRVEDWTRVSDLQA
jgi:tRNA(fMet)-specific endonuclease VapC